MSSALRTPLLLTLLSGSLAVHGALIPFQQALEQAKSEKKPIVVVWNGSDWSKEAQAVTKLVNAESARSQLPVLWAEEDDKDSLSEAELNERKNKSPSFPAWNIPAIQVYTPENEVMASFENVSPAEIGKIISSIPKILETEKQAQTIWKRAEGKSGIDAVRIYDQGLSLLTLEAKKSRKSILDKVRQADPDDKEGVIFKNNFNHQPYMEKLNSLCGEKKWDEAEKLLKEKLAVKGLGNNEKQKVMAGAFSLARNKGDKEKSLQVLTEIIKLDPNTEMGRGAKNYYNYLTQPVVLRGRKISSRDMRPDFLPMTADVGDVVKGAGTYKVEFKFNKGGASIRNAKFVVGNRVVAELPEGERNAEKNTFTLDLNSSPGSRVQLVVEAKGAGWFDAFGEIIITKQ